MSVYFATVGDYMKIGYSHDPFSRVETITRSGTRPDDVPAGAKAELVGWVPGTVWDEGLVHAHFIKSRVVGEWFRLDRSAAESVIWAHPAGVDMKRMTAAAVLYATRYPGVTRDELEAAGVRIEAGTPAEIKQAMAGLLDGITPFDAPA